MGTPTTPGSHWALSKAVPQREPELPTHNTFHRLSSPHSWTDNDGNPFTAVPESTIITNILIYWTTQTIATSFGLYRESLGKVPGRKLAIGSGYCAVPSAMAIFPRDLFVMPQAVGRLAFNLAQWTEFPSGGHFAALERPEVSPCARRRDEVPQCTDGCPWSLWACKAVNMHGRRALVPRCSSPTTFHIPYRSWRLMCGASFS
jgi:hypothetical protein